MDAATLKSVPDSKDKGTNFLPSAGSNSGWIAKGDASSLSAPTPAINSGKKLDSSLLSPNQKGLDGPPENNAENTQLSANGNGGTATRASNE